MTLKISSQHTDQFEEIYRSHYARMKRFAAEYLLCEEDAENIVQDVFLNLWEQQFVLMSHTNLFAYLFTSTKNRCLDFLRHKTIVRRTAEILMDEQNLQLKMKLQSLEAFDEKIFSEPDIESIVQKAIETLPEKCREIFVMNKIEGKKQKNIAAELNISIHTVESQMAIAHRKLKEALQDYIPLLIFLLI
ncbi:MAG: RNA polymerase subunit sigma-70 [Bacteroidetes bacterium GWD2_45_23]|nr:MAG: RNA polymerase subunit sigma-70 [Bacteroidetes bacterium GWC2_46_850]OFX75405.1 MAG: RNA polymerase subunit sigma-70 [Bacteroidetes bacterium GWC1_47_7]OFX87733.1 MAG: RNA polymerase subunit sigma-70 [Bacteroidetes bacterium GWD2_45_23]HBB01282.1 RNA polymerase sigma-70 factor [Porphyromonadaceae bacterium]HCC19268.1 RNA polymerase sigma-70 factor [Porphyromonadaceae bacterium]